MIKTEDFSFKGVGTLLAAGYNRDSLLMFILWELKLLWR